MRQANACDQNNVVLRDRRSTVMPGRVVDDFAVSDRHQSGDVPDLYPSRSSVFTECPHPLLTGLKVLVERRPDESPSGILQFDRKASELSQWCDTVLIRVARMVQVAQQFVRLAFSLFPAKPSVATVVLCTGFKLGVDPCRREQKLAPCIRYIGEVQQPLKALDGKPCSAKSLVSLLHGFEFHIRHLSVRVTDGIRALIQQMPAFPTDGGRRDRANGGANPNAQKEPL